MNGIKRHLKCRSTVAPIVAAFIGVIGAVGPIAHAATLPPPPVSPAPVTDFEYDAKGNPTKVIKAKGVSGFGFATTNAYDPLDRVKTSTDARNLDRLPASYANFYIANNVVLAPVFGHANDTRAVETLQSVFTDRRVVPINCEPLVWGMGTIHCVTQQQPQP